MKFKSLNICYVMLVAGKCYTIKSADCWRWWREKTPWNSVCFFWKSVSVDKWWDPCCIEVCMWSPTTLPA